MVYRYLQSHDKLRVNECLELCKQHKLTDATAWLLEKKGEYRQAFALIKEAVMLQLKQLNAAFEQVDKDVGKEAKGRAGGWGGKGKLQAGV